MKPQARHRLFLVDDHPVTVMGLNSIFSAERDIEVCGQASKSHDALTRLGVLAVDLVVLEIGIGGVAGLDLIQDLSIRFPRVKVLCFTVHEEIFHAERALRAGAMGYLMKTADSATLVRAVRTVLEAQVFLSENMGRRILNRIAGNAAVVTTSPISLLSNRELQVIHHIGESRDNRVIARLMSVSIKTVEAHRSKIKEKLQLRTTSDLIRFATHWVERQASFVDQRS
jgi:DNA-binding NarL/FixJ family response regulator